MTTPRINTPVPTQADNLGLAGLLGGAGAPPGVAPGIFSPTVGPDFVGAGPPAPSRFTPTSLSGGPTTPVMRPTGQPGSISAITGVDVLDEPLTEEEEEILQTTALENVLQRRLFGDLQPEEGETVASKKPDIIAAWKVESDQPDLTDEQAELWFRNTYEPGLAIINEDIADLSVQQRELFEEQGKRDILLRSVRSAFGRDLGEFSPAGQRALTSRQDRFNAQAPILNFNAGSEEGVALGRFLQQDRPTEDRLRLQIEDILAGVDANLGGVSDENLKFATKFKGAFPDVETAIRAGIQPMVQQLPPRQQAFAEQALFDHFMSEVASNPADFQLPEQRAAMLRRASNVGR